MYNTPTMLPPDILQYFEDERRRIDALFMTPQEANRRVDETVLLMQEAFDAVSIPISIDYLLDDRGDYHHIRIGESGQAVPTLTIRRNSNFETNRITIDHTLPYVGELSPYENAGFVKTGMASLGLPIFEGKTMHGEPVFMLWPIRDMENDFPQSMISFLWMGSEEKRHTTGARWRIREVTEEDVLKLQTAFLGMGVVEIDENI